MTEQKKRRLKWIAAALVLGVIAILAWQHYRGGNAADGFASGNGRIEATEIDVAAKYAGRVRELNKSWFGAVIQVINQLTMLSIILTGAALIREREHGTIEHLLIMPVTPFEIMTSKVWARGLVVLVAAGLSLAFIVQGLLAVPIAGAALFLAGAALHLIALAVIGAVFFFYSLGGFRKTIGSMA